MRTSIEIDDNDLPPFMVIRRLKRDLEELDKKLHSEKSLCLHYKNIAEQCGQQRDNLAFRVTQLEVELNALKSKR